VAEVNDKGEVTVEGEFIGRLEGFRFRQDKTESTEEARTLRQAAVAALAPAFNLRADKFYNAPDTEMDFTEQGGLMWGSEAVGKLVAGSDPLRPQVVAFVDDEAGTDVADKVRRRLQHFIDRKVSALFEPLSNLQRDETLSGMARGFAFRLVESLGVLPRDGVAEDVKALDQESRGMLRKHGVRFGQFTIFLPALLKPAPTRLRLVLWSLAQGLDTFPESPPPGLVTIPNIPDVPVEHYTLSGYRPAGSRAIRIDMLERLADLVRTRDARAGFEAAAEMLSITGMTLEQFADLMQGLGYAAERGERVKQRPAPSSEATAEEIAAKAKAQADASHIIVEEAETPAADEPVAEGDAQAEAAAPAVAPEEMEVFYTFRWSPRPRPARNDGPRRGPRRDQGRDQTRDQAAPQGQPRDAAAPQGERAPREKRDGDAPRGDRPRRDGKPQGERNDRSKGGKPGGKFGGKRDGERDQRRDNQQPRSFTSGPERKRDKIDPDNPFAAALMGLKDKK
jgi:ATP-dependent RNA helicase SUPV3L1/SUV3